MFRAHRAIGQTSPHKVSADKLHIVDVLRASMPSGVIGRLEFRSDGAQWPTLLGKLGLWFREVRGAQCAVATISCECRRHP